MSQRVEDPNVQNQYDFDVDDADEVPEFRAYASPVEIDKGIRFTRQAIRAYIDFTFDDEMSQINKNWDKCSSYSGMTMYLRKNLKVFHIITEATFSKKFQFEKFARCISDPQHKLKYDSGGLSECHKFPIIEDEDMYYTTYTVNKKRLQFCQRDFYEKVFQFTQEGVFYRYCSSIYTPDQNGVPKLSTDHAPNNNKEVVRGDVIQSLQRLTMGEDGSLKLQYLAEIDMKVFIPALVLKPVIGKSLKSWYDSVTKYYTKNHKTI